MSTGGQASLGAERVQLSPMRDTVRGRRMLRERISLAVLTFLALGAALVLLIVAAVRADGALAIVGIVVGVVAVPLFAYVALLAVGALRTTFTLHDEGVSMRQTAPPSSGATSTPWNLRAPLTAPIAWPCTCAAARSSCLTD